MAKPMPERLPEISIVLPIFNEVENIAPLLTEIETALASQVTSFEVIAVDDASRDGTSELLEQLSGQKGYLRVVRFRKNCGQAAAFDAGFRHASGPVVVTMDADRQNDPEDILPMVQLLNKGYDFVSGWRKNRRDGFILRTFPSKIANWIIRAVTRTRLHDMGCSLKVYRKEISDELRLYGEMHRFVTVLAENAGARTTEYVVNHRPRVAGQSKYGLARTFKVMLDLFTVWFMKTYHTKPIYVFGTAALLMFTASTLMLGYVVYEKLFLGVWVHKNPLFTLATISGVMASQFLAFGLIAEILVRTYFESQEKHPYSVAKKFGFEENIVPIDRKRA